MIYVISTSISIKSAYSAYAKYVYGSKIQLCFIIINIRILLYAIYCILYCVYEYKFKALLLFSFMFLYTQYSVTSHYKMYIMNILYTPDLSEEGSGLTSLWISCSELVVTCV